MSEAKPQKRPLCWASDRALSCMDGETQLAGQQARHVGHHSFPRLATAHVDVAIVSLATEAMPPPGQVIIQLIGHHITYQW
jgi:hypothetical protein